MKYTRSDWPIDYFWYVFLGFLLIIIDQGLKYFAFKIGSTSYSILSIECLPIINHGLAFSLFYSRRIYVHVFLVFVVLLFIGFFYWYTRLRYYNGYRIFAETCVLAGSISNLLDRILYGGVLDFLTIAIAPFFPLPVGNFADICIVCGLLYLCYCILKKKQ